MNIINLHYVTVSKDCCGQRIDNFLHTYLKGFAKSTIYQIIRNGEVRVNKKRVVFYYRLQLNDVLRIPPIWKKRKVYNVSLVKDLKNSNFLKSIIILYEDDYLLILNKPAGIAVHGGSGIRFGIIEILRIIRPKESFLELVHRLDRDTSGILLIAKQYFSLKDLHQQLRLRKIIKIYLALVCGNCNFCVKKISVPLKKTIFFSGRRISCVNFNEGKKSISIFYVKEKFSKLATLLKIIPITGRTHQIRVHSKYINNPIVGDTLYGNIIINKKFKEFGLNRIFLHASTLKFFHPYTKEVLSVQAPMDIKLSNVLEFLRKKFIFK